MFSCLCDSKSCVWKQVSRLCVRFLAKILHCSLCCCTVKSLHWKSKLQIWNRQMREHVPFKCLFNWLSILKFLSQYWDIGITHLLAWKICLFHAEQWMSMKYGEWICDKLLWNEHREVKWSEVKWSEVKWSEVKWSEVKVRYIADSVILFIWSSDIVQTLYLS